MLLESYPLSPKPALSPNDRRWFAWAAGIWCVLCLLMLVRSYLVPHRQTLYPDYAQAGRNWLAGEDTYRVPRDANGKMLRCASIYRYSPLYSAASVPLALLPDQWGGVLWRLIGFAGILAVLSSFWRHVLPGTDRYSARALACWWLLMIPLTLPSMNNGQANVLMLTLMLAAGIAVMHERWNLAALALAGAVYIKLYPIALLLLFVAIYPRQLGWRCLVALLAGLVLPFALQDPSYVWTEYQTWFELLRQDVRDEYPLPDGYRDFYMLIRWFGLPLTLWSKTLIQLISAGLVAAICVFGQWDRWPRRHLVNTVVSLGCCWIIVFGPATESCTYILLSHVLAWALVDAFSQVHTWRRDMLVLAMAMFVANGVACWFPDGRYWFYALQPLGASIVFVDCCWFAFQWRQRPAQEMTPMRFRAA